MKNSKEYSKKIRKLYGSLKRKYPKSANPLYDEPVDALVYAVVSERMNEAPAVSAIKRFAEHFVDYNDLRVSRTEEIVEALGGDTSSTRDTASALINALAAVFGKYNMVTLGALKKMGKKPARQILEKMPGLSPFVVDYCVLTAFQGHAIPLTEKMIDFLRSNQLVDPDADDRQIMGFLARQIAAENAYEFYTLLRRRSESRRPRRKKNTTRGTKATAETRKKTKKTTKAKKRKK
jgi:endonuclease III